MAPRSKGFLQHEAWRAELSTAGWSILTQGNAAPGAGARAAYTVQNAQTRRCVISFSGTYGDIRFEYGANAAATDFALIPDQYVVIDAEKDDQLDFWNTTGGAITVYILELE